MQHLDLLRNFRINGWEITRVYGNLFAETTAEEFLFGAPGYLSVNILPIRMAWTISVRVELPFAVDAMCSGYIAQAVERLLRAHNEMVFVADAEVTLSTTLWLNTLSFDNFVEISFPLYRQLGNRMLEMVTDLRDIRSGSNLLPVTDLADKLAAHRTSFQ